MKTLWQFQSKCVEAVWAALENPNGNVSALAMAPTGSGKSLIIAELARRWVAAYDSGVLMLVHRQELIRQNHEEIAERVPDADLGIVAAGLKMNKYGQEITCASIQTLARRDLSNAPKIGLVLIDEAHLVPRTGQGQYLKTLEKLRELNPDLRVAGFTATPYRMEGGRGSNLLAPGPIFSKLVYEIDIRQLIEENFLAPVRCYHGDIQLDTDALAVRAGEYATEGQAEQLNEYMQKLADYIRSIAEEQNRQRVLLFLPSIDTAEKMAACLPESAAITSKTEDRGDILAQFDRGDLRFLTNCEVLTTGLNVRGIDMIVLARATRSTALYVQMIGRGTRSAEGKDDCLVVDCGGNVMRHGPIDDVDIHVARRGRRGKQSTTPFKNCPSCHSVVRRHVRVCAHCQYEWPSLKRLPPMPKGRFFDLISSDLEKGGDIAEIKYLEAIHRDGRINLRYICREKCDLYPHGVINEHIYPGRRGWQNTLWKLRCKRLGLPPYTLDMDLHKYCNYIVDCINRRRVKQPHSITFRQQGKWINVKNLIMKNALTKEARDALREWSPKDQPTDEEIRRFYEAVKKFDLPHERVLETMENHGVPLAVPEKWTLGGLVKSYYALESLRNDQVEQKAFF